MSAEGPSAGPVKVRDLMSVDESPAPPTNAPRAWPGAPAPLGAIWYGNGTNFAVSSSSAHSVSIALFDADGTETTVALPERTFDVWHGFLPDVGPGQRYGIRTDGPLSPDAGLFHEPSKLLIDPYARAIEGEFVDDPSVYAGSGIDSATHVPHCVVVADEFDWADERRPRTPLHDSVIYEAHVKGLTHRLEGVPSDLRGTYAGLAHPVTIAYLHDLGVTAVELLPIHQFATEPVVQHRGLVNYWGYNTLGFFAPHTRYSSTPIGAGNGVVREFKQMVAQLHAAGIEVILDVVYNHTVEGPVNGPVLSLRGLDNHAYYRHPFDDTGQYIDYTGCGNTVDARIPSTLTLLMDSLRYWVSEMHVDGFRFDLASALARTYSDFDLYSSFFCAIQQDPVISTVKLIAEPWDISAGGYQVGGFPMIWSEWNGKYRDTVRDFWAHGSGGVRDLAYRLSGSSDLYGDDGRQPGASINFITAHDGFTLRDLVSYNSKHNGANAEDNHDGTDDNRSYNCGVEGETDDNAINSVRLRQARNLLTTLLLSTGVPMLTAGDERWRTQGGNNNAYCQDNTVSWLDWTESTQSADLTGLVRRITALRKASPVLRRRDFFDGRIIADSAGAKDVAWFRPDGHELGDADWFDSGLRTLGMYVDGRGLRHRDPHNDRLIDDSYLLIVHAGDDEVDVNLPSSPWAADYTIVLDTSQAGGLPASTDPISGVLHLIARSTCLLRVRR
jgi:isoamylase